MSPGLTCCIFVDGCSRKLLSESYGESAARATFLDRLENDARKRERNRKEQERKFYSNEALFNDPMRAKRQFQQDWSFLHDYLGSKVG